MKMSWFVLFVFGFPLLLSPLEAHAQSSGMRGMMRHGRGGPLCWSASQLHLSPEQRKELDLLNQSYLKEVQTLRAELFLKRIELRDALTNAAAKIETIQAKNAEISALQSELDGKAIDYLIKIRNLLTADQLAQWCPELDYPLRHMMERSAPLGPMTPRRPPPQGYPKKE